MKKKYLFFLFLVLFSFVAFTSNAYAQNLNTTKLEELIASKEAIKDFSKVGEYDINVTIPGKKTEYTRGYNVVIVIDGSYSTDGSKWIKMRKAVIDTVDSLLPSNTPSENVNRVALISFGMGSHVNVELTNDKNLFDEKLPSGNKGGSLLFPGRSATNTEVGFKGAYEYLSSLPDNLKKDKEHTVDFFLSDGRVNINEKEYNFYNLALGKYYTNLKNRFIGVVCSYDEITKIEGYENTFANGFIKDTIIKIKELYKEHYEEDDKLTLEEKVIKIEKEYPTEFKEFTTKLIDDLYTLIGYDKEKSYSAGDYERLINSVLFGERKVYYHYNDDGKLVASREVLYNEQGKAINSSLNSCLEDALYYPIFAANSSGEDSITRTIDAGNKLKYDGLVSTIYTIGFEVDTTRGYRILNPNYSANQGITHYSDKYKDTKNADEIVDIFEDFVYSIVKVKAKNFTYVDYTSKWVNPMDIDGDGVFTNTDIIVKNGNKVLNDTEVVVEEINDEDNKTGKTYKITWKVNEQINPWDQYTLSYRVKVDTLEDGFESSKEYHANGEVNLTYDIIEVVNDEEEIIDSMVKGSVNVNDLVSQKENVIIINKKDDNNTDLNGADFDISNNTISNVKKEYSKDGNIWTNDNVNNEATYFKFSGLYDFSYNLNETVTPTGHSGSYNNIFDFYNSEGLTKFITVTNKRILGKVIVHYVDEDGNNLHDDVVLSDTLNKSYETECLDFENYELLTIDGDAEGKYIDGEIHVTYIYTNRFGDTDYEDDILPPHTDVEIDSYDFNYYCYLFLDKKRKYI